MIRLGTIVLGAEDVERAVKFWSAVLGYEPTRFDGSANDFTILVPSSGVGTRVALQRSATPAQERPRVHLDLLVDSAEEQRVEIERLVALGAKVAEWDYPEPDDFVVVADTEGNRFCIVDTSFHQ